jgi:hypothetical protein
MGCPGSGIGCLDSWCCAVERRRFGRHHADFEFLGRRVGLRGVAAIRLNRCGLVPSRDDSRFGIGLLLDGVIVAASVVLALGSLVLGRAATVSSPRIMLAAVTAFYLGLVVGAATIARSVIELAEVFGIASVAEGVENEGTAQWLKKFGCDVVQGNYFSGPLPAGEIPHVASNPIWATD